MFSELNKKLLRYFRDRSSQGSKNGAPADRADAACPRQNFFLVELKKQVMKRSRERKLAHFLSLFREGQSVLDVGVTSERAGFGAFFPSQNHFLKNYPYGQGSYTGLSIEDVSGMEELFPGKRFVRYEGNAFPFRDKEFDWVFSNAVIEHVGDDGRQLNFLNEMMRVARSVYFTTPNKYFPLESHTNAILLHWNDGLFYRWCGRKKPWATRENLYLFSRKRLLGLMQRSHATAYSVMSNRLAVIPMTFTVVCSDAEEIGMTFAASEKR